MRRPSAVAKTNLDNLFIFAPPIVVILRVPMLENRVSVKRLMSLHRIGKRLTNIAETHPPWQKAGQRSTRNDQWNHEHDEAVPPSVGPARVALRTGQPVLCAERRHLRSSTPSWRFLSGRQSSGRSGRGRDRQRTICRRRGRRVLGSSLHVA